MKLADISKIAIAAGLLAADKAPAFEAAVLAADASMAGNTASSKEIFDKRAKDRAARDARRAKDRAAKDAKRKEAREAEDAKIAKDRAARDAKLSVDRDANDKSWAKDRNDDPEGTNDAKVMEACDAAMKSEGEAEDKAEAEDHTFGTEGATEKPAIDAKAEVAAALAARDDLHAARAEVEPILGKVTMDSAAEIRRAALKKLGVDAASVHETALAGMLQMAKDKAAAVVPATPAADAASVSAMEKLIPGYGRLK